jgi:hypothetical protein
MAPGSHSLAIDHIAFAATAVESARQGFARLGFSVSGRGRCRWNTAAGSFSAASYCVMFDQSYLDVIERADARWRGHVGGSRLYRRGLAPSGIVLRASSIEEAVRRLDAARIGYLPPYDITRDLDGTAGPTMRYRLLGLDRGAAAGLPLAFIHDSDPAAMRTPEWLQHPNGAIGLARVTLRVPDVGAAARALGALVDADGGPGAMARRGGSRIDLVRDPGAPHLRAIAALLPAADHPALLALTFRSAAIDATIGELRRHGVQWSELSPGRIAVDPEEGSGCGIEFVGGDVDEE